MSQENITRYEEAFQRGLIAVLEVGERGRYIYVRLGDNIVVKPIRLSRDNQFQDRLKINYPDTMKDDSWRRTLVKQALKSVLGREWHTFSRFDGFIRSHRNEMAAS